ncbi:DUF768 domain-containing protein [Mesorhizobium sp. B2-7-3]|nr:DUF768 domain-containing protein [Mesorhizobium sp. B2-7-3]
MRAAERDGIDPVEITDEVGSVFEVILQAMQHRDGSLAIQWNATGPVRPAPSSSD